MKPHDLIFIVLGQHLIHLYNGLSREIKNQPRAIKPLLTAKESYNTSKVSKQG
ncbi:MAG: hypothetical protein ACFWTI_06030 [Lactobacillus helveticus]|jgi:hypothetical protein|uniref:Uncharacterized protein n=1 Tax=Lactobacillus helveticus TaxID=1587 RepID=A0A3Q8SNB9_LACHE|nr:hypothetical protein LH5_01355 [Lactobacillus helveticus]NRN75541.1 hypothetical protein [Lactobacillus helveticus]NRN79648.1 hypothetical protein [Lactobacillus helveticus]NRN92394.1 hypothetical protein [Lactobacillus helveticus]NRN96591.1 hypothetical protein [Lactobacillus helveticus]